LVIYDRKPIEDRISGTFRAELLLIFLTQSGTLVIETRRFSLVISILAQQMRAIDPANRFALIFDLFELYLCPANLAFT